MNRHGSPTGRAIQDAAYGRQSRERQDHARWRAGIRPALKGASNDAHINAGKKTTMRTTLVLDDDLLRQAQEYTGLTEKSALVREALKALVEREAARRLIKLGGSDPDAWVPSRRRPDPA